MTLAVIVVGSTTAAAASDSLELDPSNGSEAMIEKVGGAGRRVYALSGWTRLGDRRVVEDAKDILVDGTNDDLDRVATRLGAAVARFRAHVQRATADTGFDAGVLCVGIAEPGYGLVIAADGSGAVRRDQLLPALGNAAVANIGMSHALLDAADTRNPHAELIAQLTRSPGPRRLPAGSDPYAFAETLIADALRTLSTVDLPQWWPPGQPAAAEPVQVISSRASLSRRLRARLAIN